MYLLFGNVNICVICVTRTVISWHPRLMCQYESTAPCPVTVSICHGLLLSPLQPLLAVLLQILAHTVTPPDAGESWWLCAAAVWSNLENMKIFHNPCITYKLNFQVPCVLVYCKTTRCPKKWCNVSNTTNNMTPFFGTHCIYLIYIWHLQCCWLCLDRTGTSTAWSTWCQSCWLAQPCPAATLLWYYCQQWV